MSRRTLWMGWMIAAAVGCGNSPLQRAPEGDTDPGDFVPAGDTCVAGSCAPAGDTNIPPGDTSTGADPGPTDNCGQIQFLTQDCPCPGRFNCDLLSDAAEACILDMVQSVDACLFLCGPRLLCAAGQPTPYQVQVC